MQELTRDHESDAVDDLLAPLRLSTVVYCYSTLHRPWGFSIPAHNFTSFHILLEGDCVLEVEGQEPVTLSARDLAFIPDGATHSVNDGAGAPTPPLYDLVEKHASDGGRRMVLGDGGTATRLFCGTFQLHNRATSPLLRSLPPMVRVSAPSAADPWVDVALSYFRGDGGGGGGDAVVTRLSEILFISALREYLVRSEGSALWGQVLQDPGISRAVRAIHDDPVRRWTVGELAENADMSRTAFAVRFHELVGETPIQYVRRCRLDRAVADLLDGAVLGRVARRAGYASAFSFSKAFKRFTGLSPSEYRRREAGAG